MDIRIFSSAVGDIIIGASGDNITLIDWIDGSHSKKLLPYLNFPKESKQSNAVIDKAVRELEEYFRGKRKSFTFPFIINGTEFEEKVWTELLTIPYGATVSYSELACKAGCPKAVRAVANAVGRNCLNIVVPCHRVIRSGGDLGGYAGGIAIKKKLLYLECDKS